MLGLNKKSGALIGAILFLVPAFFFVLWIHACNQTNGYPDNVNLYQNYLPSVLRGRFTTTILSIIFCAISVALNAGNLRNSNQLLKAVSWLIVIAGASLGFLNLFSMM
jgi:hypothetical protein